jgi:sterol 3beta-glucosyltransferase
VHITILALGSRGDALPYAALGGGLKAAGHRVRFITFESFASIAAAHELEFHPIPGDAQQLVASGGADMLGLVLSFSSLAKRYAQSLSDPRLGETDLILNQLPAALFGFDLAEKYGIPMMQASVIPLARTHVFPLMGFPRLSLPGCNKLTYRIGEQMAWQMFRPVINNWRKYTLGLRPHPIQGYFDQLGTRKFPILNGFSGHIVPRPADWNEHIHVTGYWFPNEAGWQPPKDLLSFLDAGSPPIFIGFGSMPVKDPQKATEIALEALRQSGQRGILNTGWGGLGSRSLPDSVFQIDYTPYGWLLPRMAMSVHHGGSGTTAFSLRSGKPSCVIPFVFDQFYWGERIARLGVGPQPIPYQKLTVERLRDAIQAGVHDSAIRENAASLGQKLRAEQGIQNAINIVEQVLRGRSNVGNTS